jgi:hypothetical protein
VCAAARARRLGAPRGPRGGDLPRARRPRVDPRAAPPHAPGVTLRRALSGRAWGRARASGAGPRALRGGVVARRGASPRRGGGRGGAARAGPGGADGAVAGDLWGGVGGGEARRARARVGPGGAPAVAVGLGRGVGGAGASRHARRGGAGGAVSAQRGVLSRVGGGHARGVPLPPGADPRDHRAGLLSRARHRVAGVAGAAAGDAGGLPRGQPRGARGSSSTQDFFQRERRRCRALGREACAGRSLACSSCPRASRFTRSSRCRTPSTCTARSCARRPPRRCEFAPSCCSFRSSWRGPSCARSTFLPQIDARPPGRLPRPSATARPCCASRSAWPRSSARRPPRGLTLVDAVFAHAVALQRRREPRRGLRLRASRSTWISRPTATSPWARRAAGLRASRRTFDAAVPRGSTSQDFWRRWHISLSTWLRDYLYIPLGGARLARPARTYRNLARHHAPRRPLARRQRGPSSPGAPSTARASA